MEVATRTPRRGIRDGKLDGRRAYHTEAAKSSLEALKRTPTTSVTHYHSLRIRRKRGLAATVPIAFYVRIQTGGNLARLTASVAKGTRTRGRLGLSASGRMMQHRNAFSGG